MREKLIKLFGLSLAAAAVALVGSACGPSLCEEGFKVDLESPSGYYVATVFVRDCGAFTESVTHVNLREKGQKAGPDAKGMIADGEVFAVEGHQTVYLLWKGDDRHLNVTCVGCGESKVSKREAVWREVQISYAER